MAGEKRKRFMFQAKGDVLEDLFQDGSERFIQSHPGFNGKEKLIEKYLNKNHLKNEFWKLYGQKADPKTGNITEVALGEISNTLADYIEQGIGDVFTKQGKEFLLYQTGLEESAEKNMKDYFSELKSKNPLDWINTARKAGKTWGSRRFLKKKNYISRAKESFGTLKELIKTGDYSNRPKLTKIVNEMKDLKFFDAAADAMFQNKLLNTTKYKNLINQLYKKAEEGTKYTTSKLEEYAAQKIAASILAIIGIGVILTTNNITGGVIGTTNSNPLAILWGAASLILGAWLWMKKR